MSAVKQRSRRSTAGARQLNLKGKALEADERFWKDKKWQVDDGNDAYIDESDRDEFDPDFDDSEHEGESEEDPTVENGLKKEEAEMTKDNGSSVSTTSAHRKNPIVKSWFGAVNDFFHARTGPGACKLGGSMRIAFGFLFLCDRILWHQDLHFLLSPSEGLIPFNVGQLNMWPYRHSLISLAPESDIFLWTLHYLTYVHGILFTLGIFPRANLIGMFVLFVSFSNSNDLCFDGQDIMLRIWAFLLMFFPLHRYSILSWGKKKIATVDTDSWPMWPFRLFQIQMCLIYTGAGWGKLLKGSNWLRGNALWRVSHMNDFYGGMFNPEFMFNVLGPLKLLCWSSLVVENTCWFLIWPKATRIPTLIAIVGLHVGIDMAMNMHMFEWLTILGWMSFLASPATDSFTDEAAMKSKKKSPNDRYRWLVNLFLTILLLNNWASTNAAHFIENAAPNALKPIIKGYNDVAAFVNEGMVKGAYTLGIGQNEWSMFSGMVDTRHKAFLIKTTLLDGKVVENSSPDWGEMTWYEKKRHMRPMDYIEYLSDENNVHAHKAICQAFAREYENVATVELSFAWRDVPDVPPDDLGWWDYPARFPLDSFYVNDYYTLNVHANLHEECENWAVTGECLANPMFMWESCVKSCVDRGFDHPERLKIGDRLSIVLNESPCSALVKATKPLGRYRVKVDDDRCKELEKGWVDLYTHKFQIAKDGAGVEEEEEEEL